MMPPGHHSATKETRQVPSGDAQLLDLGSSLGTKSESELAERTLSHKINGYSYILIIYNVLYITISIF